MAIGTTPSGLRRQFAAIVRERTLSWFRRAADQGDADAQGWVGWLYAKGRGVDMDEHEAVRWYRLAAEQGDTWAQGELAWMYHKGLGVAADDAEAVRLYRLAGAQDDLWAKYRLGWLYAGGHGVGQDVNEALRLFREAAEGNFAEAQVTLGDAYRDGRFGLSVDFGLSANWYRRAAEQDDMNGAAALAGLYLDGLGVEQDTTHAAQLTDIPARRGNPRAQFVLGRLHAEGGFGQIDHASVYVWYSVASGFGFEPAARARQVLLSVMTAEEISAADARFRSSVRDLALSDSMQARFEEYRAGPSIGAFAIRPSGSSWTEGYESAASAADGAMVQCEKYRRENDLPCRLFAVGPEVVFGLPQDEVDRIVASFGSAARQ